MSEPLKVLSLFSGILGLELGIKVAGLDNHFKLEQCVEIDKFCQSVIKHRYKDVKVHGDIRTFKAEPGQFDIITGGSPCTDISVANQKGRGLEGEHSGLWFEMYRIIQEAQPRIVLWENVARARHPKPGQPESPLGTVIRNLASLRYICEWYYLSPASWSST